MEQIGDLKLYTFDEVLDKDLGIESGKNLNFSTIARAFKAMGIPANLAFGDVSLSLW